MGKGVLEKDRRKRKSKTEKKAKERSGTHEAALGGFDVDDIEREKPKSSKKKEEMATHKGAKKVLRRAVKGAVKKQSRTIATSLVLGAIGGDARTAAMLLSLMEKRKESEDETRHGPSVAELLEAEPECNESMEEDPEAGSGGREPETH